MAGKQRRQKSMRENPAAKVILVVFAVFMLFSLVIYANDVIFKFDFIPSADDIIFWLNGKSNAVTVADGEIAVHFIDVEQGDCELIVSGDKTVLIDCGEKIHSERVKNYLKNQGIRKLDYIIATHPHEDHIGGMAEIMKEFKVGTVIMPEVPSYLLPMTQNFEDMLDTIDRRGITAEYSRLGRTLDLGNGAVLEFLAPVHDDYTNLNNYSITCRLVHGNKSFLFTGDIERAAEYVVEYAGVYRGGKPRVCRDRGRRGELLRTPEDGGSQPPAFAWLLDLHNDGQWKHSVYLRRRELQNLHRPANWRFPAGYGGSRMIVVDRIEEDFAVVYSGNARKDIPLSELPQGVHEGSILREVPGGYELDEAAEQERRRAISEKMRRLFK